MSIAALALGASVIERHLTIKRSDGGADAAFSLEPNEFKSLVQEGTNAVAAVGDESWKLAESETESRRLRRSLYICQDVVAGSIVNTENVRAIRPGFGLVASKYSSVLGKRFVKDLKAGTPLTEELFE